MADKNFIVSFILKGMQDSTFYKTLQSGSGMMQAFSNQTNEMFNTLGKIDPKLEKFSRSAAKVGALLGAKQLAGIGLQKSLDIFKNMKDISGPAMDFEAVMSKVQAITGASGTDLEKLNAQARELGATTAWKASQAAEAMTYLGMAGWKTEQIIAGMPGLLDLASAGGLDLARAADIVSDNLTAFGLEAKDAAHMADVYAKVITTTNTNVEMLGETMKYAAPVAHAFGASMEETAAMAGIMANSGIKASQAGTALRAGFLRLAGPPKAASAALAEMGIEESELTRESAESAAALKTLGINIDESVEGPERMAKILTMLRDKMRDMGKTEKLANLKAIFGTTAATGWLEVMNNAEAFENLTKQLHECDGEAKRQAKTMMNNVKGALITLDSAVEALSISFGNALLPVIRWGTELFTSFTNTVNDFVKKHGEAAEFFAILAAGVATLGTLFFGLITVAGLFGGVISGLSTIAGVFGLTLAGVFTAALPFIGPVLAAFTVLAGAAYLIIRNWKDVKQFFVDLWNDPLAAIGSFYKAFLDKTVYGIGYVIGWFTTLPQKIMALFNTELPVIGDNFVEIVMSWGKLAVDGLVSFFTNLPERIGGIIDSLKSRFFSGIAAGANGETSSVSGISRNATGGIYGKGAFLTTFAEDSGESAIPHTPNARNIGLLARTNEIMGNPLGGNNYSISIPITVNGGADASAASDIAGQVEAAVRRALDSINNQQRRVSYA